MPGDLLSLGTRSDLNHVNVIAAAAPVVGLDAIFTHWQNNAPLFWHPPHGLRGVAAGCAAEVRARGPQRVAQLDEASRTLWRSLNCDHSAGAPAPRLWGGLAFAPGAAAGESWDGFGDAVFVLPRQTYWTDGERAWLMVAGRRGCADLEREFATSIDALARLPRDPGETVPYRAPATSVAPPDEDNWRQQVNAILREIGDRHVRKVVAALCTRVTSEAAFSVPGVLANLRAETGPVWRFAFTRGNATFLGATPELLVRKRGELVESEALAGTLAKSRGCGSDLLASGKDRNEHQFVCDGIAEALSPLCSRVEVETAPMVRELKRLFHLATPIHGWLRGKTHVLQLCERLHPTPATGGTPRHRALEIIQREASSRGWYASPFGWFDAEGDGEFVVALRSGLLSGCVADIYAGAGIVDGSNAEMELAETQLKQRVLLRALGSVDDE